MLISSQLGYQPQSSDTSPEIDRFMMQAFSKMPAWKKAHLVKQATKGIQQWALVGIRNQYLHATTTEIRYQLAIRWLGEEIAQNLYRDSKGEIVDADSIGLALKIAEIFDSLTIPYLIGGSVASSILGEPRATLAVDIVADLQLTHVSFLIEKITGEFYFDEITVRAAIESKSSFNIIHLDSMQKVDIFVLSHQPLAQMEMQRRQQLMITQNPDKFAWVASAEDIILQKLIWYRLGNKISDRQWRDILGVIKVQGEKLDLSYLSQWVGTLGLDDLMTQALREAGIKDNYF